MKKPKKTNQHGAYSASKRTVRENNYSSDKEKIIWRFDKIDRSGKFAFDVRKNNFPHKEIMEKLIDYSNMTWSDVKRQTHDNGKSKHHLLATEALSKDAYDRFKAMELDEYSDSIFSFALQNKLRIVGYRENEHFHVLWYDPEHEICPSSKKHT